MMIRKLTSIAATALILSTSGVFAAGGSGKIEDFAFSFEGPFGTFDQNQLQRGFKVYTEMCSACHGLEFVPIRTLADPGGPSFDEEDVRSWAKENIEIFDAELDDYRPARPADHFPVSNDPLAPDLSLMAKARAGFHGPMGTGISQLVRGMGGAEYIASFVSGFTGEEKEVAGTILYENTAFSGGWTSMAPQFFGEDVEFDDGSPNTIRAQSQDVAAFLMWAAEPKMMARKQAGFVAVLLLVLMSVLLYLTNKKIWYPIKHRKEV